MMIVTRLYAKTNPDRLWNSVVEELGNYRSGYVTPFYVSQSIENFITISLQVKATDSVVDFLEHVMDFLTQKVARMDGLADSHTMPLIKLRFLPILKDLPATISRYTIEVKVHPQDYYKMYDSLLEARYDRNLAVTYIAYLFGEYDLLLSLLATDRLKVEEFANSLEKTKNALETKITSIKRTKLLATMDDWDRFRMRLLHRPSWLTREIEADYDLNYSLFTYDAPF
jgi:hypothetical protein